MFLGPALDFLCAIDSSTHQETAWAWLTISSSRSEYSLPPSTGYQGFDRRLPQFGSPSQQQGLGIWDLSPPTNVLLCGRRFHRVSQPALPKKEPPATRPSYFGRFARSPSKGGNLIRRRAYPRQARCCEPCCNRRVQCIFEPPFDITLRPRELKMDSGM